MTGLAEPGASHRGRRDPTALLPLLGVPPLLGRVFSGPATQARPAAATVILNHGYWQTKLGGDPGVDREGRACDGIDGRAARGHRT